MTILNGTAVLTDASGKSITALIGENQAKEFTPASPEWGRLLNGDYGPITPFDNVSHAALNARRVRDAMLADCDWTQAADAPVDQAAWATYRQALRDLPQQPGFPHDVAWPVKP